MKPWAVLLLAFALVLSASIVRSDDDAAAEGEEGSTYDGFSTEQLDEIAKSQEQFEFQAEVSRLMDILINSLYSNRQVFLRELVSNAADALDKIRFASLTDKSVLGDTPELEIRVSFDKKAKTLTVHDTGIGMTKDDLKRNLGIVANSGTTKFAEAAKSGEADISLIGQFGVGFYSAFLVADQVTVVSKNNDDDQHIWQSKADRTFSVTKDPRGNTLGRGTKVILHMKDDAMEFLDTSTLESIGTRYSQFIQFPILLRSVKEVKKEVSAEEAAEHDRKEQEKAHAELEESEREAAGKPKREIDEDELDEFEQKISDSEVRADDDEPIPEDGDTLAVEDEEEEEDEDAKAKTRTITVEEETWSRLNDVKPIWTRRSDDVSEDEYQEFFKALTKESGKALTWNHFAAEGEISFKSLLYVPESAPRDLYDKYYQTSNALKLYVRRVLISDEFEDFMPRYLNFIKGVVDSDDLPLNVSRETLSKSKVLKVMGKKLTRKALQMLQQLADEYRREKEKREEEEEEKKQKQDEDENVDKPEGEEQEEEEEEKPELKDRYADFFAKFGKSIKLGVIEDSTNRKKLTKLLRYETTHSDGKLIALQDYVDRMKEGQENIFYITGESMEQVKGSPFLERLKKKGYEVIYMVDPLDEYVMSNVLDYDDKKFMSVTKEGLKLGDETEEDKARDKALEKMFEPLATWLKEVLGDKVGKVAVSNRIAKSPCVLVTAQYAWSANMQRIMKAQTFGDASQHSYMFGKKTLEINPRHPLIRTLKERSEAEGDSESLRDLANLMYDAALLTSGFEMEEPESFSTRIYRVMASGLDVESLDFNEDEEIDIPEEFFEAEEEEEAEADGEENAGDDGAGTMNWEDIGLEEVTDDEPSHEEL